MEQNTDKTQNMKQDNRRSQNVQGEAEKKYSPEIQKFYKNFLAAHPQLIEKVNSQKFVFYVYVILTLLVVSFFGIFVIRPTTLTIFELREEFSDNEEVLERLEEKLAALSSLDAQKAQLTQQLGLLDTIIPQDPEIPTLVRKLETLALDNNVAITHVEVGTIEVFPNTKTDSSFFSFNFNMNVRGGVENLNAFLADFISFDRLITIDRVSGGGVGGDGETEYIIVARAYFYNPVE